MASIAVAAPKSSKHTKLEQYFEPQNKQNLASDNANKAKPNHEYTHLIAFDFDQTLSCFQVFGDNTRSGLDLFGGKHRVQLIHRFLHYLQSESAKQGHSYRIIIISYNFSDVITKRLKELNLFGHFEKIYDRHSVNKHGGYKTGKGNLLQMLARKWKVDFHRNTLLIDDCDDVIWHTHCQTVHVTNWKGMYKYEMDQICKACNLTVPPFVLSNDY
eukprot:106264_1